MGKRAMVTQYLQYVCVSVCVFVQNMRNTKKKITPSLPGVQS